MKRLVVTLSLVLLLIPATHVAAAGTSALCGRPPRLGAGYHWPIKPFDRQHPVRGAFGDPRIVSRDLAFGWTGPNQTAAYSFHNGIDITAPVATAVYPVVAGRVVRAKKDETVVHTDDGRSFQYYHLTRAPAVRLGACVLAHRTVIGWINERYDHLHLAEIDHYVVHNPLDRGHLEPYADSTRPVATDLFVDDGTPPSALGSRPVGPNDLLSVAAADPPAVPVPGPWFGLPQAPAFVEWRLFHGSTRTAWTVAADFRHTQPPPHAFWDVYGAGTYQNCPTFEHHTYLGLAGRYLFRLHLHPTRLQPGSYRLAVRVADIRGNDSTAWWPLRIVH
jgi:hypothetical protein